MEALHAQVSKQTADWEEVCSQLADQGVQMSVTLDLLEELLQGMRRLEASASDLHKKVDDQGQGRKGLQ